MSLQITLQNISKKYNQNYVIKDFSYRFDSPGKYAILGSNGSGKSTLVRILSGLFTVSKGEVIYTLNDKILKPDELFNKFSLAAPWSDVIEDLTLREFINFHFTFRKRLGGIDDRTLIELSGLQDSADKFIHQYSSGMKQRVRLLQAFFTESEVLLLDEPTSNLDAGGKQWYRMLADNYCGNRLVVVASNHLTEEYDFCENRIEI